MDCLLSARGCDMWGCKVQRKLPPLTFDVTNNPAVILRRPSLFQLLDQPSTSKNMTCIFLSCFILIFSTLEAYEQLRWCRLHVISEHFAVKLVETDSAPGGHELVNPYRTNKVDKMDLVAMAQEIQKVKGHVATISQHQVIRCHVNRIQSA